MKTRLRAWAARGRAGAAAFIALAGLAGCTLQPLYADPSFSPNAVDYAAQLRAIAINTPDSRQGIELRNALVFAFSGGGAEAAEPRYDLDVTLTISTGPSQIEQISGRPTSALTSLHASYVLLDRTTKAKLYESRSFARASFDKNVQRYANSRAERDADDRALKVLADNIRNNLAGYFAGAILRAARSSGS